MTSEFLERLRERSSAPWSYFDYMATALYDEKVGYYMREEIKLGKEGDFFTSNHVHPVFQKTFGRFFIDVFTKENLAPYICEWGAGDGQFAKNVLDYVKEVNPELFEKLTYIIIEASTYHQQVLSDNLADFQDKIQVYTNLEEAKKQIPKFEGIIFSNELIDAMPVYVVERDGDNLLEVMVDWNEEEGFYERKVPCTNEAFVDWLVDYGPPLLDGYRLEINFLMKEWLGSVSAWIEKGMVVTVDYGYTNDELEAPERKDGSLRGYYQHKMIDNPLEHSGEMDLTTHIQWDAFSAIAEELGFESIYHDYQDKFLTRAGLFTFLQEVENFLPSSDGFRQNRGIQTLVQLGGISSHFQVNVQGKGLSKTDDYGIFTEDPYKMVW